MIQDALNIISVGQCGNRIGKKFEELKIPVCYINSDSVDMRGLGVSEDYIFLLDGRGTGGSTLKGQEIFKKYKVQLKEFIQNHIDKDKINVVLFGLGGGTGGSIGPLLIEFLTSHGYKTGCICALPAKMFGILAGDNALKTLKQLKDFNIDLFILADNELLINKIGISNNWWEKVNKYIVGEIYSAFDILRSDKISQTGIGSIDRGEVMRILQYGKGMTDIRTVYLTPFDLNVDSKELSKKLFGSGLVEGFSYKDTLAYLVSIDVPNSFNKGKFTEASKTIFDLTKKLAGSAISRLGMFVDPQLSNDVIRVTMVNSGLKLPKVLQSRINNLKRDEQRFVEKKSKEDSLDLSVFEESVIEEDFKI